MSPIYVYFVCHLIILLVGAVVAQLHHPNAISAGVGLMTAAISGTIIGLYVLSTRELASLVNLVRELGFKNAWKGRGVRIRSEYESHLQDLSVQLDILGFGLRALREDFGEDFAEWAGKAKVRVLLLDPDFPTVESSYADQRDAEEQNDCGTIRSDVNRFVNDYRELIDNPNVSFEVRLYRCIPTLNIFRVDNAMFWGPYVVNNQSRNIFTFKIASPSHLFDTFEQHFDDIWQNYSRPATEDPD